MRWTSRRNYVCICLNVCLPCPMLTFCQKLPARMPSHLAWQLLSTFTCICLCVTVLPWLQSPLHVWTYLCFLLPWFTRPLYLYIYMCVCVLPWLQSPHRSGFLTTSLHTAWHARCSSRLYADDTTVATVARWGRHHLTPPCNILNHLEHCIDAVMKGLLFYLTNIAYYYVKWFWTFGHLDAITIFIQMTFSFFINLGRIFTVYTGLNWEDFASGTDFHWVIAEHWGTWVSC